MNREHFNILKKDVIYFDNAATSLKPNVVIEKINEYYNEYPVSYHRGEYDLALKVEKEVEETRLLIKDYINASSINEIIFTSGTTLGINLIVNGFFKKYLNEGDEVLLNKGEHASLVLPWLILKEELNINIKYIDLKEDLTFSVENFKKSITDKTKVIALSHITNVVGDIRDLKEIIKIAHDNNILVLVDAAQGLSHININVKELDVDFLVSSAHKMFGPTGVGFIYGKDNLLAKTNPYIVGGGMNLSLDDEIIYKSLPYKLEAGTLNISGIIGYKESIKYINELGINNINKHIVELSEYLINNLKMVKYIKILNPNSKSGIVSFNVGDLFSQDVAHYLNKYNICVRSGDHCAKNLKDIIGFKNTIRVSLSFYNNKEEIDKLVSLLKDIEKIKKEMIL